MTEPTESTIDADAQARIEKLRQRRASAEPTKSPEPAASTAPKPRRTPALGTRIAAVGIGGTTLFGLMAALALADGAGAAPETIPPPAAPQPIVVVIHTNGGDASTPATVQPVPGAPVELKAQPVVRTVEVQAAASENAPVASTNGSR